MTCKPCADRRDLWKRQTEEGVNMAQRIAAQAADVIRRPPFVARG